MTLDPGAIVTAVLGTVVTWQLRKLSQLPKINERLIELNGKVDTAVAKLNGRIDTVQASIGDLPQLRQRRRRDN